MCKSKNNSEFIDNLVKEARYKLGPTGGTIIINNVNITIGDETKPKMQKQITTPYVNFNIPFDHKKGNYKF